MISFFLPLLNALAHNTWVNKRVIVVEVQDNISVSYISIIWWWCLLCIRPTLIVDLYFASLLKQQSVDRYVAPLGHIILTASQPLLFFCHNTLALITVFKMYQKRELLKLPMYQKRQKKTIKSANLHVRKLISFTIN